jgi:hypothetical protein
MRILRLQGVAVRISEAAASGRRRVKRPAFAPFSAVPVDPLPSTSAGAGRTRREANPSAPNGNMRSMREYRFTLLEHDAERPWIVVSQEHRTATLDDDADFFTWARERWPGPRWTVELDPWQLSPTRP